MWLTEWPAGTETTVVVDTDWSYDLGAVRKISDVASRAVSASQRRRQYAYIRALWASNTRRWWSSVTEASRMATPRGGLTGVCVHLQLLRSAFSAQAHSILRVFRADTAHTTEVAAQLPARFQSGADRPMPPLPRRCGCRRQKGTQTPRTLRRTPRGRGSRLQPPLLDSG